MVGTKIGFLRGLEVREVAYLEDLLGTKEDNCIYKHGDTLYFKTYDIGKVGPRGSIYDFRENVFNRLTTMETPKAKVQEVEKPKPQEKKAPEMAKPFQNDLDVDRILKESRELKVSDLIGEFSYELS